MKRLLRKWIWMMVVLPALLMAIDCPAAYRIELKNGTSIVTGYYWEENGQIKYHQYGGVVGINRDMITNITETDMSVPREIIRTDPPISEKLPPVQAESVVDTKVEPEELQPAKVAQYQEHLRRNHREIVTYVKTYYSAMSQNNQTTMDDASEQIKELQTEQELLKKEIMDYYKGDLPDWWYDITEEH